MIKTYPAIFTKEDVGYSVSFPDLSGCFTEGDTLEQAFEMAQEALGLYLVSLDERDISIPSATSPLGMSCGDTEFISLIPCHVEKYKRKNKAVKKTLTIPQWLNDEAESRHLNFSSVLQEALKAELQLAK